jgi:hypothetical protein
VVCFGILGFSAVGSGDKSSQSHKDVVLSSNRSGICTVPQIGEKMRRVTRQTVLRRIIVHSVHYPSEGRKCGQKRQSCDPRWGSRLAWVNQKRGCSQEKARSHRCRHAGARSRNGDCGHSARGEEPVAPTIYGTSEPGWVDLIEKAVSAYGSLVILVNNAGISGSSVGDPDEVRFRHRPGLRLVGETALRG